MSADNTNKNPGRAFAVCCGVICLLTVVFIVLKLCKVLEWSWLWVFSPLWLSVALLFVLVLGAFITGFLNR